MNEQQAEDRFRTGAGWKAITCIFEGQVGNASQNWIGNFHATSNRWSVNRLPAIEESDVQLKSLIDRSSRLKTETESEQVLPSARAIEMEESLSRSLSSSLTDSSSSSPLLPSIAWSSEVPETPYHYKPRCFQFNPSARAPRLAKIKRNA